MLRSWLTVRRAALPNGLVLQRYRGAVHGAVSWSHDTEPADENIGRETVLESGTYMRPADSDYRRVSGMIGISCQVSVDPNTILVCGPARKWLGIIGVIPALCWYVINHTLYEYSP